jgi:hypothetical protein
MQSLASQFGPLKKMSIFSFLKPINQTWGGNFRCEQKGDHGFLSQDQSVKEGRTKEPRTCSTEASIFNKNEAN